MPIIMSPSANGSSVPAWPILRTPNFFRSLRITSNDVIPDGLFTSIISGISCMRITLSHEKSRRFERRHLLFVVCDDVVGNELRVVFRIGGPRNNDRDRPVFPSDSELKDTYIRFGNRFAYR